MSAAKPSGEHPDADLLRTSLAVPGRIGEDGFMPLLMDSETGVPVGCAFTLQARFDAFAALNDLDLTGVELQGFAGRALIWQLAEGGIPLVVDPGHREVRELHVTDMVAVLGLMPPGGPGTS